MQLFHLIIYIHDEKVDPTKIFWKYFKTNDSIGVTRQQTWLRNEKIAQYFGENLDILTDLIWIFNNSNWYFQNISAGSAFSSWMINYDWS